MMIIKENQNFHISLDNLIESKHMKQRQNRMLIENIHKQNIVDIFWVDKGHPNGPEIHVIIKSNYFNFKCEKLKSLYCSISKGKTNFSLL